MKVSATATSTASSTGTTNPCPAPDKPMFTKKPTQMPPKSSKESSPTVSSRTGRIIKVPVRYSDQFLEPKSTKVAVKPLRSGVRSKANVKTPKVAAGGSKDGSPMTDMNTTAIVDPVSRNTGPVVVGDNGIPGQSAAPSGRNSLYAQLKVELDAIKDGQKVIHQKMDQLEKTVKEASWIEEGKFRDMRRHMNRFQDDMHGKMDQIYGELTGHHDHYTSSDEPTQPGDLSQDLNESDMDSAPTYSVRTPVARKSDFLTIKEELEPNSD